jgi:hypothetical protein
MKEFKLENRSKIETGFKTPDHYFENFSESILLKTSKNEPKVVPLFQKRKTIFIMVAAILVIALMIPIVNTPSKISEEIDTATLENYLSYQSNINQYDLINVLESEDIYSMTTPTALEDETIEDILVSNANLEHLIIE